MPAKAPRTPPRQNRGRQAPRGVRPSSPERAAPGASSPDTWITPGLRPLAVPIESLTPDPANARRHPEYNLRTIRQSLERFGQQKPVVCDSARVVRCGNGTLEAARALGRTVIAAVISDLTEAEATAYALADNRTGELSEWDDGKLAAALGSLPADLRGVAGWEGDDLRKALGEAGAVVEDEPPAPLATAETVRGDLWVLGGHRLLCGDSTSAEDVSRVMNGERAALMNTDPPYGVTYANDDRPNPGVAKPRVAKPRVANDALVDEALQAFLEDAFRAAAAHALRPDAGWYLWHAHLTQGFFAAAAAAAAANVVLHRQIIWVKPVLLLTRGQYHWKHEPCFFGWVKGNQPPDYGRGDGERDQTTVWEIAGVEHADRREFNHSTPKPVGLFTIPIVKHTREGEIVYEPFSGSAPQIIAAEQLNRKCYAIEIEPRYVEVAVRRWQKLTGKKAERFGASGKRKPGID
jgi:DNA modification methylase